jgi:hypothetical protein
MSEVPHAFVTALPDDADVGTAMQAWIDVLHAWAEHRGPVHFWCEDGRLELTFAESVAGELVECEQSVSVVTHDAGAVGLTTVVRHAPLGRTGWSRGFHESVVRACGGTPDDVRTLGRDDIGPHLAWAHPHRVQAEGLSTEESDA